jgi:hypothetical protein
VLSLLERPLLCKPHQSSFCLLAVLVPAAFLGAADVVMRVMEEEVMRETWRLCASLQVSKSPTTVFFFPVSFFNCKYSTLHYYNAFLGSDYSFWGFYFYSCHFWAIYFG